MQIDEENAAEEAALELPSTVPDTSSKGGLQLQGHQPSASSGKNGLGEGAIQHCAGQEGIASGTGAATANGHATDHDRLDGEAQLQRTSSQRRSLYRDSVGLHSPQYAADCGSIEEPDPSLQIERISAAKSERTRSGSFRRLSLRSSNSASRPA